MGEWDEVSIEGRGVCRLLLIAGKAALSRNTALYQELETTR